MTLNNYADAMRLWTDSSTGTLPLTFGYKWQTLEDNTGVVRTNHCEFEEAYRSYDFYNHFWTKVVSQTCGSWNHLQWDFTWHINPPKTPAARLRDIIATRHAPAIIGTRTALRITHDPREIRARETLRMVVGDQQYQRFLKDGFVTAFNRQSGRTYKIGTGHDMTDVFEKGKKIARLCVLLSGNFPPTDHLIVRYLMALNDEERLWSLANKHGIPKHCVPCLNRRSKVVLSLAEEFKRLKAAG